MNGKLIGNQDQLTLFRQYNMFKSQLQNWEILNFLTSTHKVELHFGDLKEFSSLHFVCVFFRYATNVCSFSAHWNT